MSTGALKAVSGWLLVVFLATVLSPHFPWESVAPDAHHAIVDVQESELHAASHVTSVPGQDHHDEHACAGHQFGHMPLHMLQVPLPPLSCTDDRHLPVFASAVPSGVPETPLRPPRIQAFA